MFGHSRLCGPVFAADAMHAASTAHGPGLVGRPLKSPTRYHSIPLY